jgi:polysaccharide biosynthesis/export protein
METSTTFRQWTWIGSAALLVILARPHTVLAQAADALPRASATPTQEYAIGPDDLLAVVYWGDKDLSAEVVVRPDGFISLPLINDVQALGLTPGALAERIRQLAAVYLEEPNVTVVVKQINSRKVFITGEVGKPGQYQLSGPTTVLQLIAMAGGLTPFAKTEGIAIIRTGPGGPVTFTFNYKKAARLEDLDSNIVLLPGDTVIVS